MLSSPLQQPSMRRTLWLILTILILAPSLSEANIRILGNKSVPEADIALLPPVCKLILVDMKGIHMEGGETSTKFGYLLEKPEYRMAKNNPHLHHYCWSLLSRMNYFRAESASKRNYWFSRIMDDTNYVLKNSPKSWPYFHVILLEQGHMMMMQGDFNGGLKKAKEALKRHPGDEEAYALEFDAYTELNKKNKAIAAAKEGLKKNPKSRILRRRLQQAGVAIHSDPSEHTSEATATDEKKSADRLNSAPSENKP